MTKVGEKQPRIQMASSIGFGMLKIHSTPMTVVPALSGLYIAGATDQVSLLLLAATVFFLHVSASIQNDLVDLEADKINAPHRLLVRGVMTRRQVGILSTIFLVIGLLFALRLDWLLFVITTTLGVILEAVYNFGVRLKNHPVGSFLYLSMSTSTIPFLGGFIVMRNLNLTSVSLAIFLQIFSMLIMVDSIRDIPGDTRANKRTIMAIFTDDKTLRLILALVLLPIAAYSLPWLLFGFSQSYILYAVAPISLRALLAASLVRDMHSDIPRVLIRLLIIVDFTALALAKPEGRLPWL